MKKYFAIVGYLLFTASIFTMQQPAARTIAERFIKPLISKMATAAHWGTFYGPFAAQGVVGLLEHKYDEEIFNYLSRPKHTLDGIIPNDAWFEPSQIDTFFPEADPSVLKFIQEEGKKITSKEISSIRIDAKVTEKKKEGNIWTIDTRSVWNVGPAGVTNHIMLISSDFESDLKDAVKSQNKEKQNKLTGLIQHEFNHVKHNDLLKGSIALLSVPLLNHRLIKMGKRVLPFAQKIKSFGGVQCTKIFSGIAKYILTDLELKKMRRMREQRADDGICDDVDTLQGIRDKFVEVKKEEDDVIQNVNDRRFGVIMKRNFPVISSLFAKHPTFKKRIEKFDQRIEKLKK